MSLYYFNLPRHLLRIRPVSSVRKYCRHSDKNGDNALTTADNHEAKLVAVLNNPTNWDALKFVLSENKLKLIQKWKEDNGGNPVNFEGIAQIKGISKKTTETLRTFCEERINSGSSEEIHSNNNFMNFEEPFDFPQTSSPIPSRPNNFTERSSKKLKTANLMLEPKLNFSKYPAIESFTSIYQDASTITYTQFSANNDWDNGIIVNGWNTCRVSTGTKSIQQMCDQVSEITSKLTNTDLYIVDDFIRAQHFRKPVPPKRVTEIVQMNQEFALLCMLLQNKRLTNAVPNVYCMNFGAVGRLYDLFVGHEATSTQSTVKNILQNSNRNVEQPPDSFTIDISKETKDVYFKSYPVEREFLGKTLLMGLTFIRLGLLKRNHKCFQDV